VQQGDTIIDGGNTHFKDDVRRASTLAPRGIHYLDVGTSGGVWGASAGTADDRRPGACRESADSDLPHACAWTGTDSSITRTRHLEDNGARRVPLLRPSGAVISSR
jgi:hypothetical protein